MKNKITDSLWLSEDERGVKVSSIALWRTIHKLQLVMASEDTTGEERKDLNRRTSEGSIVT